MEVPSERLGQRRSYFRTLSAPSSNNSDCCCPNHTVREEFRSVLDIEKIIDDAERRLERKFTPEERHLLRLALAAYPPRDAEDDELPEAENPPRAS